MDTWTSGYVSDIDYTFGYYPDLNPLRIRLAFLNQGVAIPNIQTACELGFGQGLSTNIHAAASNVQWWGTDFNPAQAGFAIELSQNSKTNSKLYDQSFEEFCARKDLPDFDFIALHGIWSWISSANRSLITEFIRRKLRVGGVVYISYNSLPGWSSYAPLRHLLTEHSDTMSGYGIGIANRIDEAIKFADRLIELNPNYTKANPLVKDRFNNLKEHSRHYLAHEYFNRDWHPMYFSQVSESLKQAKLSYIGSSNYLDYIDAINLTSEQQAFLKEISDPIFRQTIRDFCVNQQFRRDYWTKGARRLSATEQHKLLREQRVVLTSKAANIPLKVTGSLGEANLQPNVYEPFIALLGNHKPWSLGEIEHSLGEKISFLHILQATIALIGTGHLHPAAEISQCNSALDTSKGLNNLLINKSQFAGDIGFLACPITGGGIPVNRFDQLFLLAVQDNRKSALDVATYVWDILRSQGHKIVKEGKTIESDSDNLFELTSRANVFIVDSLPLLRSLHV